MLSLPPSVRIFVATQPVDGLLALAFVLGGAASAVGVWLVHALRRHPGS